MRSLYILIATFFFMVSSVAAAEPSCQYFGPTEKEQIEGQISTALDILSAEATSESVIVGSSSRTRFSVKKILKAQSGRTIRPEIVLDTRYPETIKYEKGESYLLYTTFSPGSHIFYTNICMGTKNIRNVSKLEWELNREIPNRIKNEDASEAGTDAQKTARPF